jgi:hypothetical protein
MDESFTSATASQTATATTTTAADVTPETSKVNNPQGETKATTPSTDQSIGGQVTNSEANVPKGVQMTSILIVGCVTGVLLIMVVLVVNVRLPERTAELHHRL